VHETTDPEVVIAEFVYHARAAKDGELFRVPAVFVMRVRGGLIVESRDYVGPRQPL
jgi:ketosteroid isomerase-like protein